MCERKSIHIILVKHEKEDCLQGQAGLLRYVQKSLQRHFVVAKRFEFNPEYSCEWKFIAKNRTHNEGGD